MFLQCLSMDLRQMRNSLLSSQLPVPRGMSTGTCTHFGMSLVTLSGDMAHRHDG